MDTTSYWEATTPAHPFSPLTGDIEADVAIVGGGITGITAAMLLSRAGRSVAVLEAGEIGAGTTGSSTGNLHTDVDDYLHRIEDKWDRKTAAAVAESRQDTIDFIERASNGYGIDDGFARRPHYLFPTAPDQVDLMRRESDAVKGSGLPATLTETVPLPFAVDRALRIDRQAQFHPLRHVRGLARAISSGTCRIHEWTKVEEIEDDGLRVKTAGGTVAARAIVVATHVPKGFHIVQTVLGVYREYGMAFALNGDAYPEGIFWSLEEPSHSIRSCELAGRRSLIVIGEKHKTGQPEAGCDYFGRIEAYARERFDVAAVEHRWSAQHYRSADLLPYIGRSPGSDDIYIATGFGANGLLYGALAARIIADAILGQSNRWASLYDSRRFTPVKSAADFLKENANAAVQFTRDYLTGAEVERLGEVPPGEGRLAEVDGKKLAAYRDEAGRLTVLSPVCTHLGCLVRWNGQEKSWDCPCHGSRFRPDGEVIEGPALAPLAPKRIGE